MPEDDKSTFAERLFHAIMQQALRGVRKSIERLIKRAIRLVAMVLAGVVIAVMGVGFTAFGIVKWLSNLMPGWLAWLIVGLFLFVVGIILMLGALLTSRN